jgi:hypothetical protein
MEILQKAELERMKKKDSKEKKKTRRGKRKDIRGLLSAEILERDVVHKTFKTF